MRRGHRTRNLRPGAAYFATRRYFAEAACREWPYMDAPTLPGFQFDPYQNFLG